MAFVTYDPNVDTLAQLVGAIFTGSSGVVLQTGTIEARYGAPDGEPSTISFYDGSLTPLGIGPGLLLTSGDPTPPTTNTSGSYGVDAGSGAVDNPDADLQATVDNAFSGAGQVQDVTYLQFQINVTDPNATGIRFEVVFGSDEYPEFSDTSYVDVAGVYVNGVDYALFNNNPSTPLSVIQPNVDSGNFRDNTGGSLPIEYDGVSVKLQVTAPIHQGLNTIKIGVADTGDSIYDSGIFVAGMQAVNYAGYGLSQQVDLTTSTTVTDTSANQTYLGNNDNNTVHFGTDSGQDVYDGGGGVADQAIFDYGLSGITGFSWNGSVLTLDHNTSATTLVNVEHVLLSDGLYAALDTGLTGTTFGVYAMWYAAFHAAPSVAQLSQWVAEADSLNGNLGATGDEMIADYFNGQSNTAIISTLYHNIVGVDAGPGVAASLATLVTPSFTIGDLFAYGALLSLNVAHVAGIVGSIQLLDHSYFA